VNGIACLGVDQQGPEQAKHNGQRQEHLEGGQPKAMFLPLAAFVEANDGVAGARYQQNNDGRREFVEGIEKRENIHRMVGIELGITEEKVGATAEQPEAPRAVQNLQIQQHHACVGEVKQWVKPNNPHPTNQSLWPSRRGKGRKCGREWTWALAHGPSRAGGPQRRTPRNWPTGPTGCRPANAGALFVKGVDDCWTCQIGDGHELAETLQREEKTMIGYLVDCVG